MNEPIVFAAAKCYKLDRSGLSRSESHGRRADLTSKNKTIRKRMEDRIRNDYDPATPRSYGWAMGQDDHTAIQAAFEEHQRVTGAKFWGSKNPRIALHFILVTSSAWVKETGNPYSPKNKRVQRLIDQAIAWGEKEFGKGSVFAARYDADEMSCGVVDLFVAPVRIPGGNRKHPHIMPNKAMAELQYRTKRRKSYEALQDSWAAHCQDVLDPVFVRGKPKKETGTESIHQDVIRRAHEAEEERLAELQYDIARRSDELSEEWALQYSAFEGLREEKAVEKLHIEKLRVQAQLIERKHSAQLRAHEQRQAAKLRARTAELDAREAALDQHQAVLDGLPAEVERLEDEISGLREIARLGLDRAAKLLDPVMPEKAADLRRWSAKHGIGLSSPQAARRDNTATKNLGG